MSHKIELSDHIPARSVELRVQNVVHHTTCVSNLKAPRLNATHCGRSNDGYILLLGCQDQFASQVLRDSLGNDSNGADLK
jgi:hypothetical protein